MCWAPITKIYKNIRGQEAIVSKVERKINDINFCGLKKIPETT
jgi:hypothetical protein